MINLSAMINPCHPPLKLRINANLVAHSRNIKMYKDYDDSATNENLHYRSNVYKGGEGEEKPIMGRPCAQAHRCIRLSQTKNVLNNLSLQWRKQNAVTPLSKTRPYGIEMPS
ncbi:hypothetical protein EVAR_82813_1 [Eumeta japonica]|uniref:Uncharacterized protein n=1 Tax=Eumeta variegata TaxID=151549 RepID=A0A4C1UPJ7_EUMVA|nr:hypothetical protein EVAR_82813_1 [Eumeta japonica]